MRGGCLGEEASSQEIPQVPKISWQEQAWSVQGAARRRGGQRGVR